MLKHLKNQSGETIVEVLVSFVLLLMFTALFVVSLRYARNMSQKAELIRQEAYELCKQIYPANNNAVDWQTDTDSTADYVFTGTGSQFTVKNVQKQKFEAKLDKDKNGVDANYTFHRYYAGQKGSGTP
ncbi:type II secretion system protein [Gemmiger sp.]